MFFLDITFCMDKREDEEAVEIKYERKEITA